MKTTGFRRMAVGGGLALALMGMPGTAQDATSEEHDGHSRQARITLGYNALETAVSADGVERTRAILGASFCAGQVELGYTGLNELNVAHPSSYYGRNVLTAGARGAGTRAAVVIRTTPEMHDIKYGVRNSSLQKRLYGGGWLDMTAGKGGANGTVYHSVSLPRKSTLELYQVVNRSWDGKLSTNSEVQGDVDVSSLTKRILGNALGSGTEAFYRLEIGDRGSSRAHLFGLRKQL